MACSCSTLAAQNTIMSTVLIARCSLACQGLVRPATVLRWVVHAAASADQQTWLGGVQSGRMLLTLKLERCCLLTSRDVDQDIAPKPCRELS